MENALQLQLLPSQSEFNNIMRQFRQNVGGVDSMSPYDIAEKLGLCYTGDISLEHGGTFYSDETWKTDEYADAVDVMIDDGHVFIQTGQIHRTDVKAALRSCGFEQFKEFGAETTVFEEIEACKGYWGIESDYHDANVACPLNEDQTAFCHYGRWIPLDCLQGYIVRRFVSHLLPVD